MSVYARVKTGVPMHAFSIFSRMPNYRRWMQTPALRRTQCGASVLPSLRKFNANEVAQERLKIIEFYDAEGEEKTQKYFHVNRKTLNVCKKKLARSGHRLEALVAQSTRPKRVRRMTTDPRIVGFIRKLREEHPRLGKEKIKPLLAQHCQTLGIPSLAVSTIGKVIKRHRLFFPKKNRVYHDPNSKWAESQGKKRAPRSRVRYAPPSGGIGILAAGHAGARAGSTEGVLLLGD